MLAKLPPEPLPVPDEDEELDEADDTFPPPRTSQSDDSSSSASSTGTIKPPASQLQPRRLVGNASPATRLTPLEWINFFEHELSLSHESDGVKTVHHVYLQPPTDSGPLFVTHHGAGSSGLSFAVFSSEIQKALPKAGILSLDARGHGSTTSYQIISGAEQHYDLTLETLGNDLSFVTHETKRVMGWPSMPDIILVGHSLGGAVITDVAHRRLLGNCVLGYAVLDVVEGSALDALQSMETYLMNRPSGFPTLSSAIEWHTRSRTIRNPTSARASVPSLLKESQSPPPPPPSQPTTSSPPSPHAYTWRTSLSQTKPFWTSWFTSLSRKFLTSPGGKLLLLAGTDRLDKELMIGQMQGKYQLQVFPDAGHFIHEDQPAKTARVLAEFWERNSRVLVLPPKVGDMVARAKKEKGEEGEGG
ncbi:MAG: hypothetical protein Q9160_002020 [Pyrenula sp. 1 TL-2023]